MAWKICEKNHDFKAPRSTKDAKENQHLETQRSGSALSVVRSWFFFSASSRLRGSTSLCFLRCLRVSKVWLLSAFIREISGKKLVFLLVAALLIFIKITIWMNAGRS
jgi:hypothetical protein